MRRPLPHFLKISVVLLLAAAPLSAQNWVEIRSKNFDVITDGGEKRGRDVALRFEQMRAIFGELIIHDKINPTAPLSIIAFKDSKELSQVAPLFNGKPVSLAGVYYGGEDRHFIALDLSSARGWQVVFHEYAHMLLNTNFRPAVPWFDEGFAEYFSTIAVGKKDVKIGLAPDYVWGQIDHGMMPIEQVISVKHTSKDYNEGDRRSQFYAESWLLVHYLYDKQKISLANKYLELVIDQKVPVAEAVQQVFGVTPKQLERQLYDYIHSADGKYLIIQLPDVPEDVTYSLRKMKDFETEAVIADLHLHSRDYFERSKGEFEAILKKDTENSEATRGLGYWYLRKGDWDNAVLFFERAAKLGSTDARVHYLVAQATYQKGERDPQTVYDMMQELRKAVRLDPAYADAYNLEGYVYASQHEYESAIEVIRKAVQINPRNEHFQLNLAQVYLANDKFDTAIALFDRLRSSGDESVSSIAEQQMAIAKELKDKPLMRLAQRSPVPNSTSAEELSNAKDADELRAMEARQRGEDLTTEEKRAIKEKESTPDKRPMRYVTGKLLAIDCAHEPSVKLQVAKGPQTYKLTAANSKKVLVIGADEFSCLWKDRKISVNYHESGPLRGDIVSVEVY